MYEQIMQAIMSKNFNLDAMLKQIDTFWEYDYYDDEARQNLISFAKENSKKKAIKNYEPIIESILCRLDALEKNIRETRCST